MKIITLIIAALLLWTTPVAALALTAPEPPPEAQELMQAEQNSFAGDLWNILKQSVYKLSPEILSAAKQSISVIVVVMITALFHHLPSDSGHTIELAGCIGIGILLFGSAGSVILSTSNAITELSDYGKLLIPVMATATAAHGGVSTATAVYIGTAVFDIVLCGIISSYLIPVIYAYLALSLGKAALGNDTLGRIEKFVKWLTTWLLKVILYVFTGYMTVTSVISGVTDQSTLKATKLTISAMVPVVGGILSDASETVLAGAGIVKNTVGAYGLVALTAIAAVPFLRTLLQYLLLKIAAGIAAAIGGKQTTELIGSISDAMGMLLGMIGSVCIMLFLCMVCFLKGVG